KQHAWLHVTLAFRTALLRKNSIMGVSTLLTEEQEVRYRPPHPVKMAICRLIAAPESASRAITHDSVKIAAAVSTKSILAWFV
ncbi:hypothetical protein, partial [Paenibacillus sp. Leaf72]|uniref:hypothetical protein n=1 Tax=Paenibacillus sp. Leaf72 TaxID=1736234 RepID=UPI001F36878A